MLHSYPASNLNTTIFKAAISIAVLCLVFYFVPVTSVVDTILLAEPAWVIAGVLLLVSLRVLTALRMQMIAKAQGLDTSSLTMLRIIFTSTLYNALAPGALAGGAITYLKYRQQGIEPVAAVANIYASKSIQFLVVLLSAPLFWLIDKDFSLYYVTGYALFMIIGFSSAFALFFGRFGTLRWLAARISAHGQTTVHQALSALCRQTDKIGRISHKTIFYLVVYSTLHSLFAALSILCFGEGLNIEIELVSVLWIYSIIYLLGILPISISNIGVREVSMIMLLAPYGVSTTEATTWSILMYSGPLCCAMIGLLMEAEHLWMRESNVAAVGSTDRDVVLQNNMPSQKDPDRD
jgi:uncharacterized protein (TIRG00374 family)